MQLWQACDNVFTALFGSSEWMSINSVWMALPLMVNTAPEQWKLASRLALIGQCAQISPLLYSILRSCLFNGYKRNLILIFILLILPIGALTSLAFTWPLTAYIFGYDVSIALYVIMFILMACATTTTVVYLPYMSLYRNELMSVFFVGMGFGALFPALVALIQGASDVECQNVTYGNDTVLSPVPKPPLFSVQVYFLIMAGFQTLSSVSFIYVNFYSKTAFIRTAQTTNECQTKNYTPSLESVSSGVYFVLVIYCAWVSLLQNAVIPSIMTYSCLPYSNAIYHWCLILFNSANPLACMLVPYFRSIHRTLPLSIVCLVATFSTAYILFVATKSPQPFAGRQWGSTLILITSTIAGGTLAYVRAVAANRLNIGDKSKNRLFWCGASTQIGSFVGASIMFVLVNILQYFEQANTCLP